MSKPELIIMYTWDINGYYDNKVCGHMYEAIDYYLILKNYFDTKIIFPSEYDLDKVLAKYNISSETRTELEKSIIQRPKSGIVKTTKGKGLVLVTDGNLGNFKGIIYGIPVQFSCGRLGLIPKDKKEWFLLHDNRLGHPEELFENYNVNPAKYIFDYNKKIYPNVNQDAQNNSNNPDDTFLFYLTENCKYQSPEEIKNILKRLNPISTIYIVCDYDFNITKLDYDTTKIKFIDIRKNPINLFSLPFTHYIYTPTKRNWDCSSRLIVECKMYKKYIYFTKSTIDNIESNQGLKYRIEDLRIKNKLFGKNKILTDNINKPGK